MKEVALHHVVLDVVDVLLHVVHVEDVLVHVLVDVLLHV